MAVRFVSRVQRSRWTLPLAVAAALIVLAINELAFHRSGQALAALQQRVDARVELQHMLRLVIDAESSQRGFLLSGRAEYLEPYFSSVETVGVLSLHLKRSAVGDDQAAPLMDEILRGVEGKLSEMATMLDFHNQGRPGAWLDLLLTNIGKEKMDEVRAAAEQLSVLESARIASARDRMDDTLRISRIGLGAMAMLSLLALSLFLRQTLAHDTVQHRLASELQAERDHLETEVARRTAELAELASHLQSAREDERARLARELHDELGALLTAAKLDAARLRRCLTGAAPEAPARLQHIEASLNRGIELKRRIIEDLRPSSLANLGLCAALEIQAREFAQRTEIRVHTELQDVTLDERGAIALYRMVQESLTNAARHAQASAVTIKLSTEGTQLALEISDDGVGFDPAQVHISSHGLLGMRYRIEALGGRLHIRSQTGQGTTLLAQLPMTPRAVSGLQDLEAERRQSTA